MRARPEGARPRPKGGEEEMRSIKKHFLVIAVPLLFVVLSAVCFSADMDDITKQMREQESKITDITMTGQIVSMRGNQKGVTSDLAVYRKGDKFRNDKVTDIPGTDKSNGGKMTSVMIFDGTDYWSISSVTGKTRVSKETAQPQHLFMDFSQHVQNEGQLTGTGIVNAHDCYKILLLSKGKSSSGNVLLWIDKKSYAVVKIEDLRTRSSMVAFDYRKVSGDIELPFKNNQYKDGKLVSVTTLSSIELNKGLSDDLFDPNNVDLSQSLNLGVKSNMKKGIFKRIGNERTDTEESKDRRLYNSGQLR